MMLLLDDLPPEIIDQPGFRLLLAHIAPSHQLQNAAYFKSKILPAVKAQLPNGDVAAYRQRILENNRFSHAKTSTSGGKIFLASLNHCPLSVI